MAQRSKVILTMIKMMGTKCNEANRKCASPPPLQETHPLAHSWRGRIHTRPTGEHPPIMKLWCYADINWESRIYWK